MKILALVAINVALLEACPPSRVTIDRTDGTPPTVEVALVAPRDLNARYDEATPVTGAIDPSRPFQIQPRSDTQEIAFLISARDEQSGVVLSGGLFQVTFTCRARVLFGDADETARVRFYESGSGPRPPAGTAYVNRVVGVTFRLEDLWRQGGCTEFGQIGGVNKGRLLGIQVEYWGTATNGASVGSASPTTTVGGRFTIADASVEL